MYIRFLFAYDAFCSAVAGLSRAFPKRRFRFSFAASNGYENEAIRRRSKKSPPSQIMTADSNGGMGLFAEACEAISLTPKKTEKLRLMSDYLKAVPPDKSALGALFFTGRPFPRRDERVLGVGGSLLTRLVAEVTGATNDDLARTYRAHGDLGAMAEQLSKPHSSQGGLLLSDVAAVFDRLVQARTQRENGLTKRPVRTGHRPRTQVHH